jgi:hypothetical protein
VTPRELTNALHDVLYDYAEKPLTVTDLMRLKIHLDRELMQAISDPKTPCEHKPGWTNLQSKQMCALCGRVIEIELQPEETPS